MDLVHLPPAPRTSARSGTADFYGLSGIEEAAAYAAHPILGPHLDACIAAVEGHVGAGKKLEAILGPLDTAMKYRSSMEIFGR